MSAKDKIYASSIAGGFAGGSVGGLTRTWNSCLKHFGGNSVDLI